MWRQSSLRRSFVNRGQGVCLSKEGEEEKMTKDGPPTWEEKSTLNGSIVNEHPLTKGRVLRKIKQKGTGFARGDPGLYRARHRRRVTEKKRRSDGYQPVHANFWLREDATIRSKHHLERICRNDNLARAKGKTS